MFVLFLTAVAAFFSVASACTTFVITPAATSDGSTLGAHSADGSGTTDPRLVRISGNTYPKGSQRAVFSSPELYPRFVGVDPRAKSGSIPEYLPENCEEGANYCKSWSPIGYIPQVERTYSYYEAVYGIMNEHQVGILESTCSAVYSAKSISSGGSALLSINQLSQIAMERAKSAKEAVQIMGSLSEQYGFYGASASFEGAGESLIVTDPHEAWVFHILADSTGKSSIWVGARVPDGHVAVVANMYSIQDVDLADSDNFLGRQDMWDLAEAAGLWKPGDPKNWVNTFSDGEYAHRYYSGRRMWSVFRLVAPNHPLPAEYENLKEDKPYPFSIPVGLDKASVGPDLMFRVMRDYYNGTEYTLGSPKPAGGAYGTIERYGGQEAGDPVQVSGNWERPIALYRTAESYIVQSGGYDRSGRTNSSAPDALGGVIWFGAHSATYTVYVPVIGGGLLNAPKSLSAGWQGVYDLSTNFWASRSLAMLSQVKWNYMIPLIRDMQHAHEKSSLDLVQSLYTKYDSEGEHVPFREVENFISKNSESAVEKSLSLFHQMIFKFADGFLNTWSGEGDSKRFSSSSPGYPGYWLQSVDYPLGPPPV
jgi:dipeptidase